jgi:biopolymer transport protein ExbB
MIWEFIMSGGLTMIPLLLCSILAITIIIFKALELRRSKYLRKKEVALLKKMIKNNDFKGASYYCVENAKVFTNIIARALENRNKGEVGIREAIEEAGRYEIPKIERWLGPLRTIAAISPLLGLFGTVTGMIRVFNEIQVSGLGEVNTFSGGIAEALITTATGLAIAIPTLVMYNYFVDKSEGIILEVEKETSDIMRVLTEKTMFVETADAV